MPSKLNFYFNRRSNMEISYYGGRNSERKRNYCTNYFSDNCRRVRHENKQKKIDRPAKDGSILNR